MDYSKNISQTSKQFNYIQSKAMNEQIRKLLVEQLKKKTNKQKNLMNKKKLLHKKTKWIKIEIFDVNQCKSTFANLLLVQHDILHNIIPNYLE